MIDNFKEQVNASNEKQQYEKRIRELNQKNKIKAYKVSNFTKIYTYLSIKHTMFN